MSDITVRSNRSANAQVFAELEDVEGGTRRAIRQSWFALADDIFKRANEEILRKPKRGRVYIRRDRAGRRRRHVASAPGETHANMTGRLRKALSWIVHGNAEMRFGYGVNKQSPEYDENVEFGARHMAARPSIENAIDDTQGNAQGHFEGAMDREFGT